MRKKLQFSKLFRWFAKGYSLVLLFYFAFTRFLFFQFSPFSISTSTSEVALPAGTNAYGWLSFVFGPAGLLLIIISLGYLAWKEKHWLSDLIYPVVVLSLIVIGIFLH